MILRILLLLLLPVFSYAQPTGSLIIIAEQGDPFYLYLNGQKMNETAVTKIRLDGLSGEYYTVKADFKSSSIQPVTKRLNLMDDNYKMSDATYKIRKDKSGKARFVFFSMQTPNTQYKPEGGMHVIYFNKPEETTTPVQSPAEKSEVPPSESNAPSILTNVKGATVSLPGNKDANRTPVAAKADSKADKPALNKENPSPAVQKTKELPVTDATPPKKENPDNQPVAKKSPDATKETIKTEANVPTKESANLPNAKKTASYPSKKCNDWPMMKADFQHAKKGVEEAKNEKQRLVKAKDMANANCLLVSQISEVSALFTDEKLKLEFVQYAYGFTIDKNNYQRLEKLFTASENIQAFQQFYQSRTKE